MSTFTPKDYEQVLVDLLPSYLKQDKNLVAILTAIGTEFNATQDELLLLVGLFSVNSATGETLDVIGRNVNVKRSGKSDEELRKAIVIQTAVNVSKGRASDLINITKAYSEAEGVEFFEYGALSSLLQVRGGTGDQTLADLLKRAAPAGGTAFVQVDEDQYSCIPVEAGEEVSNTSGLLSEVDESFDLLQTDTSDVGNLIVNEDNLVSEGDNLYYQGEVVEYAVIVINGVEYYDIIFAGTSSDSFPAPSEAYY